MQTTGPNIIKICEGNMGTFGQVNMEWPNILPFWPKSGKKLAPYAQLLWLEMTLFSKKKHIK